MAPSGPLGVAAAFFLAAGLAGLGWPRAGGRPGPGTLGGPGAPSTHTAARLVQPTGAPQPVVAGDAGSAAEVSGPRRPAHVRKAGPGRKRAGAASVVRAARAARVARAAHAASVARAAHAPSVARAACTALAAGSPGICWKHESDSQLQAANVTSVDTSQFAPIVESPPQVLNVSSADTSQLAPIVEVRLHDAPPKRAPPLQDTRGGIQEDAVPHGLAFSAAAGTCHWATARNQRAPGIAELNRATQRLVGFIDGIREAGTPGLLSGALVCVAASALDLALMALLAVFWHCRRAKPGRTLAPTFTPTPAAAPVSKPTPTPCEAEACAPAAEPKPAPPPELLRALPSPTRARPEARAARADLGEHLRRRRLSCGEAPEPEPMFPANSPSSALRGAGELREIIGHNGLSEVLRQRRATCKEWESVPDGSTADTWESAPGGSTADLRASTPPAPSHVVRRSPSDLMEVMRRRREGCVEWQAADAAAGPVAGSPEPLPEGLLALEEAL